MNTSFIMAYHSHLTEAMPWASGPRGAQRGRLVVENVRILVKSAAEHCALMRIYVEKDAWYLPFLGKILPVDVFFFGKLSHWGHWLFYSCAEQSCATM